MADGRVLIKVKTNLRMRLSESSASVIKMKCTLCTLSVHGGCVRVLGMGVKINLCALQYAVWLERFSGNLTL